MTISIKTTEAWQTYWGATPLPEGAIALGVVTRSPGDRGALIQLASGVYMQGNAHALRSLPQDKVEAALRSGRPLAGDEPRKQRQLTLPDSEFEQLKEIGKGNASAAVSQLLQDWRERQ